MKEVKTRIAPSPTGHLHVGTARTALFSWLFARKHGGSFVLRVEDTDRERSKPEYEATILESLTWLGLTWDEFYRQSERAERHIAVLGQLIAAGKAYISEEAEGKNREVVRFKNPNTTLTFTDAIRGDITFDTTELGDFIIARNPEDPLYNFAVVVDDIDMNITHVIRGEDHISNTPRQILLVEAIGAERPVYAHLPMILAPDRSKLSKRHGAVSVTEYEAQGYLPEAFLNYLALLGWNPGTELQDKEIFTLPELTELFTLERVQKGGAIFNEDKIKWFNKSWLDSLTAEEKISRLEKYAETADHSLLPALITNMKESSLLTETVFERATILSDITNDLDNGEYTWLFDEPAVKKEALIWKKSDASTTKQHLEKVETLLKSITDVSEARNAIWPYAEEAGRGDVLWPLRVALSGRERSPDPFTLISILGLETARARVTKALQTFIA